ncbi:tetratricopeptide repeat protein [Brachyspira alvinipulli]|uniref:tetratricopeptide repeat protein n=1 Tax=Brachyspira alvinipulli TaxID=84379 RepID=UPI000483A99D|nr:tetratricopeptide repeat protein [Brachyspira alvinipulli]
MRVFLYSCTLVMFTVFSSLFAQGTITVQPDDKVVTNTVATRIKGGPMEKDLVKSVDLAENTLFSIKLNATNFDRYIRITSYSTNLDFVRFTRDKTNAFITFRTLTAGVGKLDFQVDNEENIIRKYFYTINVTNAQGMAVMETNTVLDTDSTNDMSATNMINTNNAATNNTATNRINNAATNNTATNTINNAATNNTATNNTATNRAANNIVNTDNTVANNTAVNNNANTDQANTQASVKKENAKTPAEANPETVALFNSAEDLRNIKDYKNAVNTYNKVISEYPDSKYSVYSHFRIGDIYNYNKDYTNAFDMYQKASSLKGANNDEKAAAIYSMGVIKKLENKHDEAIAYFNDVMTKYSKSSVYGNAAYEVADSLKQLGRMSDGASILEKSLDGNKKFSKRGDAILLLAEIYEKGDNNVRDFDKAYQTYNQYLTEYPTSSKAQYANDRKNFLYRNAVNLR